MEPDNPLFLSQTPLLIIISVLFPHEILLFFFWCSLVWCQTLCCVRVIQSRLGKARNLLLTLRLCICALLEKKC